MKKRSRLRDIVCAVYGCDFASVNYAILSRNMHVLRKCQRCQRQHVVTIVALDLSRENLKR